MRVKGASISNKKRKKLFTITKGYWGQHKNAYRRDRKRKKRDFRRLWITRISAAVRSEGMSYSAFMNGLKRAGITMNRKMLSELAIHDVQAFRSLVEQAKSALK